MLKTPQLLICDLSEGDFSLLPALITSTFLGTHALIFSISAVLSRVASVLRITKDFLLKFLFLEVGGMMPHPPPPRLASLGCKRSPLSHFSPPHPQGHAEMPNPRACVCSGRTCAAGSGGGVGSRWFVPKIWSSNPRLPLVGDLEDKVALVSSLGGLSCQ